MLCLLKKEVDSRFSGMNLTPREESDLPGMNLTPRRMLCSYSCHSNNVHLQRGKDKQSYPCHIAMGYTHAIRFNEGCECKACNAIRFTLMQTCRAMSYTNAIRFTLMQTCRAMSYPPQLFVSFVTKALDLPHCTNA